MRAFSSWAAFAVGLLAHLASAAPYQPDTVKRQDAGKLVFAHFMMGIIPNRESAADYDNDMKLAKAAGIDAFALNIGTDEYTESQLELAYESAANNDMKVFISFDFNWFGIGDTARVGDLIKATADKPAQLKVDGKPFVSSFVGDGLSVENLRSAAGLPVFFAPNFSPSKTPDPQLLDGAFNWMAWNNNGANRAPKDGVNITVAEGDSSYTKWLGSKDYVAPVSPWFSTHYGTEVSYPKNWVFPGDLLWFNRWNEILELAPRFVEIITWNDYGESHYIGPLSSKHTDDGNSKWVNDMPHNGWLDMAKPFIAAYKAGQKSPASYITDDKLVFWYRPTLKSVDCSSTDTTGSPPDGADTVEDAVFVVALLKEAGQVTATSGENSQTFEAPAGASAWKVPMGVGKQTFSLARGGQQVMSETSLRDVSATCPCGLYNYNAFVGTVPAGTADALGPEGLTGFSNGLKVDCVATPSLGTIAPAATSAVSANPAPSSRPVSSNSTVISISTPTHKAQTTRTLVSPSQAPLSSSAVVGSVVTSTTAESPGAGGCTQTITASSQIFPTNCLGSGQIWAGGVGSPDCCDGATPCCG